MILTVLIIKCIKIIQDLDNENRQIEASIKKLQTDYFRARTLSSKEYQMQYGLLNERLAEIEGKEVHC